MKLKGLTCPSLPSLPRPQPTFSPGQRIQQAVFIQPAIRNIYLLTDLQISVYMLESTGIIFMYQLIHIAQYIHSFNTYLWSCWATSRGWGHHGA